jgi:hypothetical protein
LTYRPLASTKRPNSRPWLICAALIGAAAPAWPAAVPVAAASPTPNSEQVHLFGVHPLHQGQTTLPGGHFNFALSPGGTITDGVVVENFSDRSLDFHIYGADLLTVSGGGFAPAQPSDQMHDAGAWISMSAQRVTVPAHSQFTDRFTVSMPSTVPPGEHRGAVVAAAIIGKSPQGSTIEARTALITVINVPGAERPSASLSALSRSAPSPHDIGFGITLNNTGNLLLTYVGSVEIDDGDGHKVAILPLAPTDAYVVPAGRISLATVWKDAIPQSRSNSARATVTILANGKPVATLTSGSLELPVSASPPLPLALAVVLSGLAATAAITVGGRRIRRRRYQPVVALARSVK